MPQLNEINGGDFDGLAYEEIAEMNPVEFAKRDQDKLRYRYPNGESYVDVCRYDKQGSFVNDVTLNLAFSEPLSVTLLFPKPSVLVSLKDQQPSSFMLHSFRIHSCHSKNSPES